MKALVLQLCDMICEDETDGGDDAAGGSDDDAVSVDDDSESGSEEGAESSEEEADADVEVVLQMSAMEALRNIVERARASNVLIQKAQCMFSYSVLTTPCNPNRVTCSDVSEPAHGGSLAYVWLGSNRLGSVDIDMTCEVVLRVSSQVSLQTTAATRVHTIVTMKASIPAKDLMKIWEWR